MCRRDLRRLSVVPQGRSVAETRLPVVVGYGSEESAPNRRFRFLPAYGRLLPERLSGYDPQHAAPVRRHSAGSKTPGNRMAEYPLVYDDTAEPHGPCKYVLRPGSTRSVCRSPHFRLCIQHSVGLQVPERADKEPARGSWQSFFTGFCSVPEKKPLSQNVRPCLRGSSG